MNKIAVLYESKYGYTETYARWLAEALKADLFPVRGLNVSQLKDYDRIILGGGRYAINLGGSKFLTEHFKTLQEKYLACFTVGLSDPVNTSYQELVEKAFTPEQRNRIKIFHLRGGMDFQKLSFMHKTMLKMMKKVLSKQENLTEENKAFLDIIGTNQDFSSKESLNPIIEWAAAGN